MILYHIQSHGYHLVGITNSISDTLDRLRIIPFVRVSLVKTRDTPNAHIILDRIQHTFLPVHGKNWFKFTFEEMVIFRRLFFSDFRPSKIPIRVCR
jgi:hypothetical protein